MTPGQAAALTEKAGSREPKRAREERGAKHRVRYMSGVRVLRRSRQLPARPPRGMGTPMIDSKAALGAPASRHRALGEVEEAVELLHDERFRDALYALRDVIKASPQNPLRVPLLGWRLETAQPEAARDAYRAAVRLAPNYLGARVALSHVLRMLGDLRGAIAEAEEALVAVRAMATRCTPRGSRTRPAATTRAREIFARLFGQQPRVRVGDRGALDFGDPREGGPIASDEDPSEYD